LANREDHPAYGLARGLAGSAAELRSYLSGDFPWSLGYADYAELLPVLEDALDAIAEGITAIHGETHDADETTYMHLSEAAEGTDAASSSLYTVRDWYVKAAREAEARQADRVGRAAETAWTAGAEHGRDGHPPAIIHEDENFYWNGPQGEALATSLGIHVPPADAIIVLSNPDGEEVAVIAAAAYCDAYAEAHGLHQPARFPGRYLAGQPVTTALGRSGTLTGDVGPGGNPRVRFDDGQEATVPREAICAPLGHVFATRDDAAEAAQGYPGVMHGDVLLIRADGSAWVQTGAGVLPADERTAAREDGWYKASVRTARKLAPAAGTPAPSAEPEFPAGPVTVVSPAATSGRGSTRSSPRPAKGTRPGPAPRPAR
jgi:hypothetical protein